MSEELKILNAKLDVVIKLMYAGLSAGKVQNENIIMLKNAGLQQKEIAEIVGTTSNTVNVALHRSKTRKTKKGVKGGTK